MTSFINKIISLYSLCVENYDSGYDSDCLYSGDEGEDEYKGTLYDKLKKMENPKLDNYLTIKTDIISEIITLDVAKIIGEYVSNGYKIP